MRQIRLLSLLRHGETGWIRSVRMNWYISYEANVGCLASQIATRAPHVRLAGQASEPSRWQLRLDDPDFDLWVHVRVQPHRHAVHTERLDRLVQVDLSLFDVNALRGQLCGDIAGRH